MGGASKPVAYNDIGGITSKSDVWLYMYNAAGSEAPRNDTPK